MKELVYIGPSDFRELSSKDLGSIGVTSKKDLLFARGVPLEVTNEVSNTLLGHVSLRREFAEPDNLPKEFLGNLTLKQDASGVMIPLEIDEDPDDDDESSDDDVDTAKNADLSGDSGK